MFLKMSSLLLLPAVGTIVSRGPYSSFRGYGINHFRICWIKGGQIRLIKTYVDDLLIACSDKASLDKIKKSLLMKFEMKDMKEARKCLGVEYSGVFQTLCSATICQYVSSARWCGNRSQFLCPFESWHES
jgi:hypothetical protein